MASSRTDLQITILNNIFDVDIFVTDFGKNPNGSPLGHDVTSVVAKKDNDYYVCILQDYTNHNPQILSDDVINKLLDVYGESTTVITNLDTSKIDKDVKLVFVELETVINDPEVAELYGYYKSK